MGGDFLLTVGERYIGKEGEGIQGGSMHDVDAKRTWEWK